eukprot:TRINITY_DN4574_c0_g1_i4.p1 TRINITY_DN4574_c0_g1~~TRINITY_DN4574_c0_g1_i4.p1  ORF type:complete len:121 (-),score=29.75 TRINITY_DN4574_c0_g1_i4:155-517(-)
MSFDCHEVPMSVADLTHSLPACLNVCLGAVLHSHPSISRSDPRAHALCAALPCAQESLFYLGCRGINAAEARALVIKGFAFDMIKALPDTKLQARVLEKLISMTPKSSRAVTAEGAFSSI